MLVNLDLKDRAILIVGAGHIGSKKVRKFLKAKAKITVMDKVIDDKLRNLPIKIIENAYDQDFDMSKYFLVYACTDNAEINEKIVANANADGCFSASVTKNKQSNFNLIRTKKLADDIEIGMNTNGNYLFLPKALFKKLQFIFDHEYADKLPYLNRLRKYIIELGLSSEEKHYLLEDLVNAPVNELAFYEKAITEAVNIMVLHGNQNPSTYNYLQNYVKKLNTDKLYYCFIKREIKYQDKRIVTIEHLHRNLSLLKAKKITYLPLLVEPGYFYRKLAPYHNYLAPLPLNNKNLKRLVDNYEHSLIIILHGYEKDAHIIKLLKELDHEVHILSLENEFLVDLVNDQLIIDNLSKNKTYEVIPFFMLDGTHLIKDSQVFADRLSKLGYQIIFHHNNLLELPIMKEYLMQYLKK